jgi:phosphoribosylformylglycinamidine synthase
MVKIADCPSIFFEGMVVSRMPIVVSYGAGRRPCRFLPAVKSGLIFGAWYTMHYVNNRGSPTELYPVNPNGSFEMRGNGWDKCGCV